MQFKHTCVILNAFGVNRPLKCIALCSDMLALTATLSRAVQVIEEMVFLNSGRGLFSIIAVSFGDGAVLLCIRALLEHNCLLFSDGHHSNYRLLLLGAAS